MAAFQPRRQNFVVSLVVAAQLYEESEKEIRSFAWWPLFRLMMSCTSRFQSFVCRNMASSVSAASQARVVGSEPMCAGGTGSRTRSGSPISSPARASAQPALSPVFSRSRGMVVRQKVQSSGRPSFHLADHFCGCRPCSLQGTRGIRAGARTRRFGISFLLDCPVVRTHAHQRHGTTVRGHPCVQSQSGTHGSCTQTAIPRTTDGLKRCSQPPGPTPAGTTGDDATLKPPLSETR